MVLGGSYLGESYLGTVPARGTGAQDSPIFEIAIQAALDETNYQYQDAPEFRVGLPVIPGDQWWGPAYEYPAFVIGLRALSGDAYGGLDDSPEIRIALAEAVSELQIAEHVLLVRERPPLRLAIDIAATNGATYRWALDENKPENRPRSLTFGSTMPGGFEHLETELPRQMGRDYEDLAEFSTITVRSPAGRVVWQGRLETAPRTSGDQMSITPGAVGWQAALDDDKSAREIYVDRQLGSWGAASSQRQIDYLATVVDLVGGATAVDAATGYPALGITFSGSWARSRAGEAWYDAKSIPLGSIYAAWKATSNAVAAGWGWGVALSDDDRANGVAFDNSTLVTSNPGSTTVSTATATRKFACAHVECRTVNTSQEGAEYTVWFTCLAVYGKHGLTKRGSNSYTDAMGLYASDIVAHAVGEWAPALNYTTGADGTIQPSTFVIPHASFPDATTVSAIVREVTKFELQDWAVWEGPTFFWHPRGTYGKQWRALVGPSGLSEQGPQVDRIWNSVVVEFSDVTGKARTVGPTGSGTNYIDANLEDTDPLNPVTVAGLTRRAMLKMGTSTLAGAVAVGEAFLAEQKVLSTAGEAHLVGFVTDSRGVVWPASYVRAGDEIAFTDSANPEYRRIVKASYDNGSKTCQISLDSPAEGLTALLERLNVVLVPLGF